MHSTVPTKGLAKSFTKVESMPGAGSLIYSRMKSFVSAWNNRRNNRRYSQAAGWLSTATTTEEYTDCSMDNAITEDDDGSYPAVFHYISCPHCSGLIMIDKREINCGVFRHLSRRDERRVSPHAPQAECQALVRSGEGLGCGGAFRFDGTNTSICGYDT